jgi:hypothetical protein
MAGIRTNQRPSTTMNLQRRISSKRPASRGRLASPSTSIDDDRPDLIIQQSIDQISVRNVFGLLDKFDKWEMCELLTTRDTHWLLTNGDVYKVLTLNFICFSSIKK